MDKASRFYKQPKMKQKDYFELLQQYEHNSLQNSPNHSTSSLIFEDNLKTERQQFYHQQQLYHHQQKHQQQPYHQQQKHQQQQQQHHQHQHWKPQHGNSLTKVSKSSSFSFGDIQQKQNPLRSGLNSCGEGGSIGNNKPSQNINQVIKSHSFSHYPENNERNNLRSVLRQKKELSKQIQLNRLSKSQSFSHVGSTQEPTVTQAQHNIPNQNAILKRNSTPVSKSYSFSHYGPSNDLKSDQVKQKNEKKKSYSFSIHDVLNLNKNRKMAVPHNSSTGFRESPNMSPKLCRPRSADQPISTKGPRSILKRYSSVDNLNVKNFEEDIIFDEFSEFLSPRDIAKHIEKENNVNISNQNENNELTLNFSFEDNTSVSNTRPLTPKSRKRVNFENTPQFIGTPREEDNDSMSRYVNQHEQELYSTIQDLDKNIYNNKQDDSQVIFTGQSPYNNRRIVDPSNAMGQSPFNERRAGSSSTMDQSPFNERRAGSSSTMGQSPFNERRAGSSSTMGQSPFNERRAGSSSTMGQSPFNERRAGSSSTMGQSPFNERRAGSSSTMGQSPFNERRAVSSDMGQSPFNERRPVYSTMGQSPYMERREGIPSEIVGQSPYNKRRFGSPVKTIKDKILHSKRPDSPMRMDDPIYEINHNTLADNNISYLNYNQQNGPTNSTTNYIRRTNHERNNSPVLHEQHHRHHHQHQQQHQSNSSQHPSSSQKQPYVLRKPLFAENNVVDFGTFLSKKLSKLRAKKPRNKNTLDKKPKVVAVNVQYGYDETGKASSGNDNFIMVPGRDDPQQQDKISYLDNEVLY